MAGFVGTLLITRSQLAEMLALGDYIDAVEDAFRKHAQGTTFGVSMIHGDTPGPLEFHIKAGGIERGGRLYYGIKANGSSFQNMKRFGLPNIMGAIVLFDGEKGIPLAVIDSIEPTIKRTGAGSAVAAKYLARKESRVATICGCGNQGRIQLRCLKEVRSIDRVFAWDQDPAFAQNYAHEMSAQLGIRVEAVGNLGMAVRQSDMVVTCTPSRQPFLMREFVAPGTLVAAIGADSPAKQEVEASLLAGNKVVVDILEQCAQAGELHHALDAGLVRREDVHATIGQVVAGMRPGRESDSEIIVYDATGTALQDVAAAAMAYEKAVKTGWIGQVTFAS